MQMLPPPRVVEIKCAFKHKDILPMEAAKSDPDFCLDSKGHLKDTHAYYTQIQLEAHVNRMDMWRHQICTLWRESL